MCRHRCLLSGAAVPICQRFRAKGATEILYRSELGDAEKIAGRTMEYEANFANPFKAAERGFIDEVIMPHSSRKRIARAFAALRTKKEEQPWKKHDTIPL